MSQAALGDITILLAGQTGVGRSTLINMITGASDGSEHAARVSNDVRPCPIETTVRIATLEVDGKIMNCKFSDTRGLDEPVDHPRFMDAVTNWFRQQALEMSSKSQSKRDLQKTCRERIGDIKDGDMSGPHTSIVILMWCIHASKIDVSIHWRNFRETYVHYCQKRVKPVVVITQMTPEFEKGWEERCRGQLGALGLGIGHEGTSDLLLMVRRYRNQSSDEYTKDCLSLRRLVFRLSTNRT